MGRRGGRWRHDETARNGWTILARNFRVGRKEVDLVARRGRVVAFVEVKARRTQVGHRWKAVPEPSARRSRPSLRRGSPPQPPGDVYHFDHRPYPSSSGGWQLERVGCVAAGAPPRHQRHHQALTAPARGSHVTSAVQSRSTPAEGARARGRATRRLEPCADRVRPEASGVVRRNQRELLAVRCLPFRDWRRRRGSERRRPANARHRPQQPAPTAMPYSSTRESQWPNTAAYGPPGERVVRGVALFRPGASSQAWAARESSSRLPPSAITTPTASGRQRRCASKVGSDRIPGVEPTLDGVDKKDGRTVSGPGRGCQARPHA